MANPISLLSIPRYVSNVIHSPKPYTGQSHLYAFPYVDLHALEVRSPPALEILRIIITPPYKTIEQIMRENLLACIEEGKSDVMSTNVVGTKNAQDIKESLEIGEQIGAQSHFSDFRKHFFSFEGTGGETYMSNRILVGEATDPDSQKISFYGIIQELEEDDNLIAEFIKNHFQQIFIENLPNELFDKLTAAEINRTINHTYAALKIKISTIFRTSSHLNFSIAFRIRANLYFGHVGNSRIIILKKDGRFKQCTSEKLGQKTPQINLVSTTAKNLLKISNHSQNSSSNAAIDNSLPPRELKDPLITGPYKIEDGDRLLAASEGVFDLLTSSFVNETFKDLSSPCIPEQLGALTMGVAYRTYKMANNSHEQNIAQVDKISILVKDLEI